MNRLCNLLPGMTVFVTPGGMICPSAKHRVSISFDIKLICLLFHSSNPDL